MTTVVWFCGSDPQLHSISRTALVRKRGSRHAFEVLVLNAHFRGNDEKSRITYANFCKEFGRG
jgi:hypothetical protein